MLSDSLSMVTISRMVGNELKCSGFSTNNTVIRITTDTAMESASAMSRRNGGNGSIRMMRMQIMPTAKKISARFDDLRNRSRK